MLLRGRTARCIGLHDPGDKTPFQHLGRHGTGTRPSRVRATRTTSQVVNISQKSSGKERIKFRSLSAVNEGERRRNLEGLLSDAGQRKWVR